MKAYLDAFGEECRKLFEEATVEKKPVVPPVVPEEKPAPKPEVEKKEKKEEVRSSERDCLDIVKDEHSVRSSVKERDRYSRPVYVPPRDYSTPGSSDIGYGTSQSDSFSTGYGSTNTTPLGYGLF